MYETHFGFSGPPFQLHPDPTFYFGSAGHSKALSYLRFGVQQGEGFIVITGDVGAGKTTLVRALLQELDASEVVAAQLSNTQLDAADLLHSILHAFGVAAPKTGKAALIASLEAFLTAVAASGRRALLIVDEAQNLSAQAIEELRMLSNFQLGHHGLLQSFLVGQPELRLQLQSPAMEQLRQRVLASYHLGPLGASETGAYIEHRLRHVGWSGRPGFGAQALQALHVLSGGIPRRINTLCNRLLLAAYLKGVDEISGALVAETADELLREMQPAASRPPVAAPVKPASGTAGMPAHLKGVAESERSGRPAADRLVAVATPAATDAAQAKSRWRAEPAPAVAVQRPAEGAEPPLLDALVRPRIGTEAEHAAAAPSGLNPITRLEPALATGRADRLPLTSALGGGDAANAPQVKAEVKAEMKAGLMPVQPPAPDALRGTGSVVSSKAAALADARAAVLCVADTPLAWFKLRSLSRRWVGQADLPPMVLVHPGSAATLQLSWQHQIETAVPVREVHLGVGHGPAGQTQAACAQRFADLLEQTRPAAVLICGASYALLQCALMARQLQVPVIRLEGGAHRADVEGGKGTLCALLDRTADLLAVDSRAEQSALIAEGFAAGQMACTGSLIDSVLRDLQPLVPDFGSLIQTLAAPRDWLVRAAAGFGLITAQFEDGDVPDGDALQWLMLARQGSLQLPFLWPVNERTAAVMQHTGARAQIESAGIAVVSSHDYFQQLGLLTRARCVMAGPARALVEEAAAWQVPSVIIQLYADAPCGPESGLVSRVGPSASQLRAAIRLAAQMRRPESGRADRDDDAMGHLAAALQRWLSRAASGRAMALLDEAAA
ncbi:MAG: AAA family ATPase [Rubrivivax sp.]|nr:AAA family ATPase [Rubrivivax sp.]